MTDRFASFRSDVARRVTPALRSVAAHRFWFECGAVTSFALIAALAVGRTALDRADQLRADRARLEAVRDGVDGWLASARPAAPAESLLWRRSEQDLQRVSSAAASGLAMAQLVARRAEQVGVPDVRVRLVSPDSIPEAAEGFADGSALDVEFEGDWSTVLNFLGVIPPPMSVVTLTVARQGGLLRANALVVGGGVAQ